MNKRFSRVSRRLLLVIIDILIVFFSCMAVGIIFDFLDVLSISKSFMLTYSTVMAFLVAVGMIATKMYNCIWRYASLADILKCAVVISVVWVLAFVVYFVLRPFNGISEIYCIFSFEFATFLFVLSRCLYKIFYIKFKSNNVSDKKINTLIVGAGHAGNSIITEMLRPESEYLPVAIVDDDKGKNGRYIHGIKVVGTTNDIPKVVNSHKVKNIIVAMPSCDSKRRKEILDICSQTSCDVRILPYLHKMIMGENLLNQAKEINIEDLLGRDPIKFDAKKNQDLISGKVCLVTGGGGSIGSELSRQIAQNNPKQLVIVDIYENNAYEIQQELLRKYGKTLDLEVRIASVREYNKMEMLFEEFRPQLVFHAAAHKHVPLMEDSPTEAVKNNVFGTYNVAKLAEKFNVEKFILVSTDKAVNPTNVMGATKRCCEMIVECMKQTTSSNTEFVAVRFGNVLGSNGSVVPLFKEQIKKGGPVTVTHPDIIRYFMTIPEATSLILQAASFAHGGEIFVLDMGEPVKILTLAENVIKLSGKKPYEEIKIEFTGLRPGEKLYEELLMGEEGLTKTENNKIFIGKQVEIDTEVFMANLNDLREIAYSNDNDKCVAYLEELVPTFKRKIVKQTVKA